MSKITLNITSDSGATSDTHTYNNISVDRLYAILDNQIEAFNTTYTVYISDGGDYWTATTYTPSMLIMKIDDYFDEKDGEELECGKDCGCVDSCEIAGFEPMCLVEGTLDSVKECMSKWDEDVCIAKAMLSDVKAQAESGSAFMGEVKPCSQFTMPKKHTFDNLPTIVIDTKNGVFIDGVRLNGVRKAEIAADENDLSVVKLEIITC